MVEDDIVKRDEADTEEDESYDEYMGGHMNMYDPFNSTIDELQSIKSTLNSMSREIYNQLMAGVTD